MVVISKVKNPSTFKLPYFDFLTLAHGAGASFERVSTCSLRNKRGRQDPLSLAPSLAREAKAATVLTEMQGNTANCFLRLGDI